MCYRPNLRGRGLLPRRRAGTRVKERDHHSAASCLESCFKVGAPVVRPTTVAVLRDCRYVVPIRGSCRFGYTDHISLRESPPPPPRGPPGFVSSSGGRRRGGRPKKEVPRARWEPPPPPPPPTAFPPRTAGTPVEGKKHPFAGTGFGVLFKIWGTGPAAAAGGRPKGFRNGFSPPGFLQFFFPPPPPPPAPPPPPPPGRPRFRISLWGAACGEQA